jgi:tight adherence protein C
VKQGADKLEQPLYFYLILIIIFFSISAAVYLLLNAYSSKNSDKLRERLKYAEQITDKGQDRDQIILKEKGSLDKPEQNIFKILYNLVRIKNRDDSKIRNYLVQAGYRKEDAPGIFIGMKIFLGISLLFAFFITGYFSKIGATSFLIAPIFGLVGYLTPNIILSMKINHRQNEINNCLPDALDFLVVCVEAGLGLNSSLVRVGKEMYLRSKVLSEEFLLVNQEMITGISREMAFANLASRNRSKPLRILVSAIIVSDHLGTNIADTLRAQSESLRTQFRQQAEEQAAKAGIKILFPLVFFILPTLFIVILGPTVIQLIQDYLPQIGK